MSYQYVLHTIPYLVEIKPGWLSAQASRRNRYGRRMKTSPLTTSRTSTSCLRRETSGCQSAIRPSRLRRSGSSDAALHRELDRLFTTFLFGGVIFWASFALSGERVWLA
jgi:hypothetical protein